MYGLPIHVILILATLFFIMLIYTIVVLPHIQLLSPLLLACLISVVSLIFTRKRIDRILIPFSLVPFVIACLANIYLNQEKFVWYLSFVVTYWSPMNYFGSLFLSLLGLGFYSVSRNKFSAILPLLFSIGFNAWHLARNLFRYISFPNESYNMAKQVADLGIRSLILILLFLYIQNVWCKEQKLLTKLSPLE